MNHLQGFHGKLTTMFILHVDHGLQLQLLQRQCQASKRLEHQMLY